MSDPNWFVPDLTKQASSKWEMIMPKEQANELAKKMLSNEGMSPHIPHPTPLRQSFVTEEDEMESRHFIDLAMVLLFGALLGMATMWFILMPKVEGARQKELDKQFLASKNCDGEIMIMVPGEYVCRLNIFKPAKKKGK